MSRRIVFIVVTGSLLAAGITAAVAPAAEPATSLEAQAARAGLRVMEGSHLTLITDRPARPGDGVEALPRLFDEAVAAWCRHYGLDPAAHGAWRAVGCLVVDKERFREAGLLPAHVPDFKNGFCAGDRFWLMDQSNPAYRRHLLLHEGVHAFTLTLLRLDTQPWYTEGIAELLATHRLDGSDAIARFVATPMPRDPADVEQLGRIEAIRAARAADTIGSLGEVFATPPAQNHELTAYASSWAAVAMLSIHPRYADAFARTERSGLDAGFTSRLIGSRGWDEAQANRDFDAFTDDIDYGYDFARSAIDWSPAAPLAGQESVAVAADRGWQHSGLALQKGRGYEVHAAGRVTVGQVSGGALESEPAGISITWYRGRPLGRLLAAQWVTADGGPRPRFVVVAEGDGETFTAAADGPLYFKVNESPGQLGDNDGSFTATVAPAALP
jgi:hypothetical protein